MKINLVTLIFWCITLLSFGQSKTLIWEDDFDSTRLDLSKWNIETGTGVNGDFGTGQVDRATDREENISFYNDVPGAENGCLAITTRKEFYIDRNYTSGRINTGGKASWGPGHRIVARVFPRDVKQMGQGFAFWMMPDEIPAGWDYIMWPQGGEMDIMEYVGSIPFHNLGSVHYAWFWQNNQWADWNHGHKGAYYSFETEQVPVPLEPGYGNYPPDEEDENAGSFGFHTYGIDWYADRIEFFIDDNVYHIHYLNDGGAYAKDGEDQFAVQNIEGRRVGVSEYSNHFSEWYPFEHKMYVILSAGVGGSDYTYGGPVNSQAKFPCSVFIDWVRVYKLDLSVGVEQQASFSDFSIYPNPVNKTLNLKSNTSDSFSVRLLDINGRIVLHKLIDESTALDVSSLKHGIYSVMIETKNRTYSKQLIIQ